MNFFKIAAAGFILDFGHFADGWILIHKRDGSITDEDLEFLRVNCPSWTADQVWKSDYQTVVVG